MQTQEKANFPEKSCFGNQVHEICVDSKMIAHLIGGTCELFRHFYGLRRFTKGKDRPFGADPLSIPDLLALVGDAADGYPGIPGIGAKTGGVEWGRV